MSLLLIVTQVILLMWKFVFLRFSNPTPCEECIVTQTTLPLTIVVAIATTAIEKHLEH